MDMPAKSSEIVRPATPEILWEVRSRFHTFTCESFFEGGSNGWMVWILRDGRRISGYRFMQRAQADEFAQSMRSEFVAPIDSQN
jgi:hypothetical protein